MFRTLAHVQAHQGSVWGCKERGDGCQVYLWSSELAMAWSAHILPIVGLTEEPGNPRARGMADVGWHLASQVFAEGAGECIAAAFATVGGGQVGEWCEYADGTAAALERRKKITRKLPRHAVLRGCA